jgi:hypothetical protein
MSRRSEIDEETSREIKEYIDSLSEEEFKKLLKLAEKIQLENDGGVKR